MQSASESSDFKEIYESAINLAEIVSNDPAFDLDIDNGDNQIHDGLRRVPTASMDQKDQRFY